MRAMIFLTAAIGVLFLHTRIDAATLDQSIKGATSSPVAKFEFRVKETAGFTLVPVNDPGTNDPDGDNDVEVVASDDGSGGSEALAPLSLFLTGQPTGGYIAEVRSVDSNGNASGWVTHNFNYDPPPDPQVTIVLLWPPDGPIAKSAARIDRRWISLRSAA